MSAPRRAEHASRGSRTAAAALVLLAWILGLLAAGLRGTGGAGDVPGRPARAAIDEVRGAEREGTPLVLPSAVAPVRAAPCRALPEPGAPAPVAMAAAAGAGVLGRLLDDGGAPWGGAALVLRPRSGGGRTCSAVSAPDGAFLLTDVPPGEWWLEVGAHAEPFLAPRPVTVLAPLTRLGDVVAGPTVGLDVRVLDERGTPVPDVVVECVGTPIGRARATSGPDGVARFEGLAAGLGRAFARDGALGRGSAPYALEPPSPGQVELRLARRGTPPAREPIAHGLGR